MLPQEIQAALPGERRIAFVIARTRRIGKGMVGFIPMTGIGPARLRHLGLETGHHSVIDPTVALGEVAENRAV